MFGEAVFVGAHQERLSDGGAGLKLAQVGGAFGQAESADAGADGPGTDEGHLAAGGPQAVDLVGESLDARRFQRAVGAGEHVGADLDDDGVGQGDDFLPDRIEHRNPRSKGSGGSGVRGRHVRALRPLTPTPDLSL